jgi:hypothetical protein
VAAWAERTLANLAGEILRMMQLYAPEQK